LFWGFFMELSYKQQEPSPMSGKIRMSFGRK